MSNPTEEKVAATLPQPIAEILHALIQRVRGVILVRGIAAVVTTAAGALLAVMAIDAGFTLFAEWPRWILTLTAFALTAGAAVWFLILPLARTITLSGIARAIEEHHP